MFQLWYNFKTDVECTRIKCTVYLFLHWLVLKINLKYNPPSNVYVKSLNRSIYLNISILITTIITIIIVQTSRKAELSGYNGKNLIQRNELKEKSLYLWLLQILKKDHFYNLTYCLIPMCLFYLTRNVERPSEHFFLHFINKCLTVQLSKNQCMPCPTILGKYAVVIKLRKIPKDIHTALSEHI